VSQTGDNGTAGRPRAVISIDAMGGDRGPGPVLSGMARAARKAPDIAYILHGPEKVLAPLVRRRKLQDRVQIRDATEVVSMDDRPSQVVRRAQNTSMYSAIESLRNGEADVVVSAGNTGVLMALSMLRLRRQKGINRPAIACLWPSRSAGGFNVMLDVGADIRADGQDLLRYALMGVSYARTGLDIANPRVGLLNVGTEEHKGRTELKEAHDLIAQSAAEARFDFVGFVEGDDIPGDTVDVIVTDGFTGNIALKTGEGTAALISQFLRQAFKFSPVSRLAALLAYGSLQRLRKRIDPRRVNGGVFLGLNGTVVKSHGSADATSFSAAVLLACRLAEKRFHERLVARVASAGPVVQDDRDQGPADSKQQ